MPIKYVGCSRVEALKRSKAAQITASQNKDAAPHVRDQAVTAARLITVEIAEHVSGCSACQDPREV